MHKGLGNSQKAEVAWLEKQGYAYEEVDVRVFRGGGGGAWQGAVLHDLRSMPWPWLHPSCWQSLTLV